jgi:AraC-like DNA-binding protein
MKFYWPADKQHQTQVWGATLVELAISRGANIEHLLRGTSLFKQDLSNAEHKISTDQLCQLIQNCQKYTRSQDLSFMLGRRLLAAQSSKFVSLLQHARNYSQLARIFQLYQAHLFPISFGTVKEHEGHVYFIVNPAIKNSVHEFMFEVLCAAVYQESKRLCGKLIPFSFSFEQGRPRNIYQFEENLGSRLRFAQPINWIKLDKSFLQLGVQSELSFTRISLLQQSRVERLVDNKIGVLQYLYKAIEQGRVNNLDQASEFLQTSPATLKRKLKLTGMSFQSLQDSVRKQQAVFELAVCKQNNGEVARKLQFSDVTNFRRAFKRWTGLTPAQLKAD